MHGVISLPDATLFDKKKIFRHVHVVVTFALESA